MTNTTEGGRLALPPPEPFRRVCSRDRPQLPWATMIHRFPLPPRATSWRYRACGSFFAPRFGARSRGRGHDRADVAVRRLVQIDDDAAVAGPVPLRACRSTQAARARPATGAVASTRSIRMPRS